MVKKIKSKYNFYYTQCGDWEAVVPATCPKEACWLSVRQSAEKYGKSTPENGALMLAMDIRREVNEQNGNSISIFKMGELKEEKHEY